MLKPPPAKRGKATPDTLPTSTSNAPLGSTFSVPLSRQQVETLGAHLIPRSFPLGSGFGVDIPMPELWGGYSEYSTAVGKRVVWLDQQVVLLKLQIEKLERENKAKDAELAAEKEKVQTAQVGIATLKAERRDLEEKLKTAAADTVAAHLASDQYKKDQKAADKRAVTRFKHNSDFLKVVDEKVEAWKKSSDGLAWEEKVRKDFIASRRMADLYVGDMRAARCWGVTETSDALSADATTLPGIFPECYDPFAADEVMTIAMKFGIDLTNVTPDGEEDPSVKPPSTDPPLAEQPALNANPAEDPPANAADVDALAVEVEVMKT